MPRCLTGRDRASSRLACTAVGDQGGHAAHDRGHACGIRLRLRKIKHTRLTGGAGRVKCVTSRGS
jgi:hypothetical protein